MFKAPFPPQEPDPERVCATAGFAGANGGQHAPGLKNTLTFEIVPLLVKLDPATTSDAAGLPLKLPLLTTFAKVFVMKLFIVKLAPASIVKSPPTFKP